MKQLVNQKWMNKPRKKKNKERDNWIATFKIQSQEVLKFNNCKTTTFRTIQNDFLINFSIQCSFYNLHKKKIYTNFNGHVSDKLLTL